MRDIKGGTVWPGGPSKFGRPVSGGGDDGGGVVGWCWSMDVVAGSQRNGDGAYTRDMRFLELLLRGRCAMMNLTNRPPGH